MPPQLTVRTSEPGWLAVLARAYREQTPTRIIDDAGVGIDPAQHSLFDMGRRAPPTRAELGSVGIALGLSTAGVAIMVLAFLDPEPTSKLGLAIGAGAVLALTGGLSAIHVLTQKKPPQIRVGSHGFEISWA